VGLECVALNPVEKEYVRTKLLDQWASATVPSSCFQRSAEYSHIWEYLYCTLGNLKIAHSFYPTHMVDVHDYIPMEEFSCVCRYPSGG